MQACVATRGGNVVLFISMCLCVIDIWSVSRYLLLYCIYEYECVTHTCSGDVVTTECLCVEQIVS